MLRFGLFQIADDQLEQVDLPVELFAGLAEPGSPKARQLGLQLLDMKGFGIEFMLQRPGEGAQPFEICGQFGGRQRHGDL
jgi:hypothetical protein